MNRFSEMVENHPVGYSVIQPDKAGNKPTFKGAINDDDVHHLTFGAFYRALQNMVYTEPTKANAPLICPLTFDVETLQRYNWNGARCIRKNQNNADLYYMVVADFDDDNTVTVEDARERYQDYAYILHTSFSHESPDKHGSVGQRFRMYFPLGEAMTTKEHNQRNDAIFKTFLAGTDPSNGDICRGYFAPIKREGYEDRFVMECNDGKLFDGLAQPLNAAVLAANDPAKKKSVPEDREYEELSDDQMEQLMNDIHEMFEKMEGNDPWWRIVANMVKADIPIDYTLHICNGLPCTNDSIRKAYSNPANQWNGEGMGLLIWSIRKYVNPRYTLRRSTETTKKMDELEEQLERLKANSRK